MIQTNLLGRECRIAIRDNGPKSITGIIVGARIDDVPRIRKIISNIQMTFCTTVLIELHDFAKGSVYEIPIEWIELTNPSNDKEEAS